VRLSRRPSFVEAYADLTSDERERVDKALRLLADDWRYPSLQVKRVLGTEDIWEARASLSLRITFELAGDTIILRNVGAHDKMLRDA
jgi:mRNA interferase RelE/StbE